ncbi:MAG TPA: hypothetical protein VMA13_09630 [Candidatus Saccharimonadales bacterium]|nr:hypothetical protein [Candidatus Saccharimonadales bacterium]
MKDALAKAKVNYLMMIAAARFLTELPLNFLVESRRARTIYSLWKL